MGVFIFIIGLFFGSFYLVLGLRLPKNEDAIFSRSKCDNCGKTLKWYQLIPLLSYVFLKGKCGYCNEKISILNPIIELVNAILFLIGYLLYGISLEFGIYLIIASLMIIIFISDFKYMIINDSPLFIGIIGILIIKFLIGGYKLFLTSLLSGILLFFVMYLVGTFGKVLFKKDALGGGDVKLSFLIGSAVLYNLGLCTLILSVFLALPYSVASMHLTKNNEVAYGPFLIGALYIVFIFADKFSSLLSFILG